ncbi:N-acetylmuramoyl-L-alanine amidase [Streptomyces arboris]|uniref:N-acetylmuramoyl-L-alanine amidase n=1 Tax=Streptomyces arboris TaxID=2600619 RepID=UPI003C2D98B4
MPYDDSVPPTRRARPLLVAAALAALCLTTVAGCGGSPDPAEGKGADASPSPTASASTTTTPTPKASPSPTEPLPQGPLTGKTVVIDPGHNPRNREHTKEINEQVDIGTGRKECDTTGTSTNAGYAEARFTLDVSHRLRELLQAQGARVLLTHDDDRPFGPCIDERARIGNEAKADAVVSVHADGSAVGNRGFHVILPAAVKGGGADTSKIVKSSADLGARIAGHFVRATGSAPSNYIGGGTGLDTRDDLGGLNLSTVPKVFVECGNMRDPKDAALLTDASWRQKAAQGMADGIAAYVKG